MATSRFKLVFYALLIMLAPIIETSVFASMIYIGGSLLLVVAVFGWFVIPRSWWWRFTLLGAVWQDLFILTPYGTTVLAVVVLGGVLALVSQWLTSRSFWMDTIMVLAAFLAALLVSLLVRLAVGPLLSYPGGVTLHLTPLVLALLVSLAAATWLHRDVTRHQYLH